jgi:isorenieratene synthase
VQFQLGLTVLRIDTGLAKTFRVHTDSGDHFDADAVVLATDVAGLQHIVAASAGLGDQPWRARVDRLRTAPPFAVQRLWLDRPVTSERPAFLGTAGHKPLDNVSVLERYERQAAEWADRHGGSVVELHAYALQSPLDDRALVRQLQELYPETAAANVLCERVLHHSDCPLFEPGSHAHRPGVATPQSGLVLAGDGIRIDLPVALMERAATTGWAAANHLLTQWGLAGHALHTAPNRGRSALLRSLATREERRRR